MPMLHRAVPGLLILLLVMFLLLVVPACSRGGKVPVNEEPQTGSEAQGDELLRRSAAAADKASRFSLTMKLKQQLQSNEGEESLELASDGRVERNPLRIDQMVVTGTGEEEVKQRTLWDGKTYYVEDLTFGEGWSRIPETDKGSVEETISGFQKAPGQQIEQLRQTAGGEVQVSGTGKNILKYESGENSEANRKLLTELLRSTLGAQSMTREAGESLKIEKLSWEIEVSKHKDLPARILTDASFSIELEPGNAVHLQQTLEVSYSKWEETPAILIPEKARTAPEMSIPSEEEQREMERQIQKELDRLQQEQKQKQKQ